MFCANFTFILFGKNTSAVLMHATFKEICLGLKILSVHHRWFCHFEDKRSTCSLIYAVWFGWHRGETCKDVFPGFTIDRPKTNPCVCAREKTRPTLIAHNIRRQHMVLLNSCLSHNYAKLPTSSFIYPSRRMVIKFKECKSPCIHDKSILEKFINRRMLSSAV